MKELTGTWIQATKLKKNFFKLKQKKTPQIGDPKNIR